MSEHDLAVSPEGGESLTLGALGSRDTREFVRYFGASLVALLVDVGTLFVCTSWLAIPYLYSGAIAFTLGLIVIYILSISWVFERRAGVHPWIEFAVFALIGIIGLGINEGVLYILTGLLGVYYLLSKVASVFVVFTWNFFARKYLLFRA